MFLEITLCISGLLLGAGFAYNREIKDFVNTWWAEQEIEQMPLLVEQSLEEKNGKVTTVFCSGRGNKIQLQAVHGSTHRNSISTNGRNCSISVDLPPGTQLKIKMSGRSNKVVVKDLQVIENVQQGHYNTVKVQGNPWT